MIQELIIRFDYHSAKTVKKLREIEVEMKNVEDEKTLQSLKNTAKELLIAMIVVFCMIIILDYVTM